MTNRVYGNNMWAFQQRGDIHCALSARYSLLHWKIQINTLSTNSFTYDNTEIIQQYLEKEPAL